MLSLTALLAAAAPAAELQVTCEPGIRIYVDGVFRGVSRADQDGLYIEDLEPGSHVITFRKRGFTDRAEIVDFRRARSVQEIVLETMIPQVSARVEVSTRTVRLEAQTAAVDVRCIPAHCTVELAEHRIDLAGGIAKFDNVPAGDLRVTVTRDDVALVTDLVLGQGERRQLLADFARDQLFDDLTGRSVPRIVPPPRPPRDDRADDPTDDVAGDEDPPDGPADPGRRAPP